MSFTIPTIVEAQLDEKKQDCLLIIGFLQLSLTNKEMLDSNERLMLAKQFGYNCFDIDYSKKEYLNIIEDSKNWTWERVDGVLNVKFND